MEKYTEEEKDFIRISAALSVATFQAPGLGVPLADIDSAIEAAVNLALKLRKVFA